MKIPKKLRTLTVAPGFAKDEIYEAASHNYQVKVHALRARYQHLIMPGTVADVIVAHDHDCRIHRGGPGCNCDPDVSLMIDGVTYR